MPFFIYLLKQTAVLQINKARQASGDVARYAANLREVNPGIDYQMISVTFIYLNHLKKI